MTKFEWRDGVLHAEDVPVPAIADAAGTPTYVYSASRHPRGVPAAGSGLRAARRAASTTPSRRARTSTSAAAALARRRHGRGLGRRDGARLAGRHADGGHRLRRRRQERRRDPRRARRPFSPLREDAARFGVSGSRRRAVRWACSTSNRRASSRRSRGWRRELGVAAAALRAGQPQRRSAHPRVHDHRQGREQVRHRRRPHRGSVRTLGAANPSIELAGLHIHIGSPVPKVEPYVESIGVVLRLIDELEARGHADPRPRSRRRLAGAVPRRRGAADRGLRRARWCRCSSRARRRGLAGVHRAGALAARQLRRSWWRASST